MLKDRIEGARELTEAEMVRIDGGTALQYALFFVGCFKAGFLYGYNELGPALLGE